jgi:hypothetical protein
MKLSTINESTDITGKLDPLITKYESLKAKADGIEQFHYKTIIERLKNINTLEELKDFLKIMNDKLNDENDKLQKLKATADPSRASSYRDFTSRLNSVLLSVSLYNDIIAFGKSIKLL